MRVAIITESFPPDVNSVAHCVLQIAENLFSRGHQPLVIAPRPSRSIHARPAAKDPASLGYPVVRVPSAPLPGYRGFRLGWPPCARTACPSGS
jgi:phosphatidylinositol alpha 1,6-mannosyltransferase